jgi:hypothetical protein
MVLITASALDAENRLVKTGVLAKRGEERTITRWKPTADYLTEKIDGHR